MILSNGARMRLRHEGKTRETAYTMESPSANPSLPTPTAANSGAGSPEPVSNGPNRASNLNLSLARSRSMELVMAFVLGGMLVSLGHLLWRQVMDRPQPMEKVAIIDLNRADRSALAQLPGIGPARAAQIEAYREQHGPIESIDDLRNVPGIGPARTELLKPVLQLPLDSEEPRTFTSPSRDLQSSTAKPKSPIQQPLDLNRATAAELQMLPGIGPVLAERILEERRRRGFFQRLEDLNQVKGIKGKTLEKIAPYLEVKPPYPPLTDA